MKKNWINSPYTFSLGMFAMMVPSQAFSSFYSYYYVEKLGLGIALATAARTVFLIWDAVNQPMFGYWSDRTNSRFGRRKPWIYAAIPWFMLAFVLLFSPPGGLPQHSRFAWFLVALILFEAAATVLWVNYGALFPELFLGDRLRAKASAVQQGYQIVALLIGSAATPLLFNAIGFGNMALVYAVLFAVSMLACMRYVRESEDARLAEPLKLAEAFRATLRNRKFWLFNLANSFAQTVNGLLSSVIPSVAVWYGMVRTMSAVKAWRLSLALYGLAVIPLWFGSNLASGIAAGIAAGFGLAGFLVTPPIVGGRIIDEDAAQTGRRREGMYTAISGFITRSSGLISALAFLVVGMIFGYESGDRPGPNPEEAFRYLISAVPLGLLIISYSLSLFVKDEAPR